MFIYFLISDKMNKIIAILLLAIATCSNLRNLASFNFDTFYTELVNRHNVLRKKHSAGSLTKLADIAKLAQVTADKCKAAQTLQHSGTSYNGQWMGQNLYVIGGAAPTGAGVADSWYSENKDYDYATGKGKTANAMIGHFTQLVWKASKQIGCAVATGTWSGYNPSYFVCCNYFPGGNVQGQYTTNVAKPTS